MDLIYRKHEGVTLVCQNNDEQQVTIFGLNPVMQRLTGFEEEAVKGEKLQIILGAKQAEMPDDYVEYEGDTNDLGQVIGKMRELRFRHKDGHEVSAENFKVVRIDAKDRHQWFRLIVEDAVHKREVEAFKKILTENFKGHEVLDSETGLPDSASIRKDLELSQYYADTKNLHACFAYVRIDDYSRILAKHGKKAALAALVQVASSLRRNLRGDDTIGRIAEDALGVLLMDIEPEPARVVMNRLRWLIGAEESAIPQLKGRGITASICFAPIHTAGTAELPERCAALLTKDKSGLSQLAAAS